LIEEITTRCLPELSVSATATATAAKAAAFSAACTAGTTPTTAEVAFIALPTSASATAEASFTASASAGTATPIVTGFCLGLGFIDGKRPSLQFLAVQAADGGLGGFFRGHFNKTETLRPATKFIHDYTD
jgi:hypothetical protein